MSTCKSILIIDDDLNIRDTLKEIFESDGHTVHTSENGLEAFGALKVIGNPALIFLDIHMPVMGGLEFFQILKTKKDMSDIPVVVMTAGGDLKNFTNANLSIKKPFELDTILKVAKTFCCIES